MKNMIAVAVSAFGLASVSPAFAASELEKLMTYCKPDVERLCATTPVADVPECLKAHKMEISVGCAEALKALKE